jgi:hypothetical protein
MTDVSAVDIWHVHVSLGLIFMNLEPRFLQTVTMDQCTRWEAFITDPRRAMASKTTINNTAED